MKVLSPDRMVFTGDEPRIDWYGPDGQYLPFMMPTSAVFTPYQSMRGSSPNLLQLPPTQPDGPPPGGESEISRVRSRFWQRIGRVYHGGSWKRP